MPVEPPPCEWLLPSPELGDEHGVCGIGADLAPGTLLAAYRTGLFPMRAFPDGPIAWWSPDPRGIIPLDGLRVSRSLRRATARFDVTFDTDFEGVMRACADPRRPHGWIDEGFIAAYVELHGLGWAHSIETRDATGALVGGLYGVQIGGLFAGESMFHRATDASKVALVATVELLRHTGATLFDVQWTTDHLESLGAVDVPRSEYLTRLRDAVRGRA
ncbi:MAG: aat [Actinomycetia bacterium]|nr:aat [Actinomycetes bacterium]